MVDIETQERVQRLEKIVKDNNKMLHRLQSRARWESFMRIVYWAVLIAIALGAYYYIQPYIEATTEAYRSLQDSIQKVTEVGEKIPEIPDIPSFGDLFGGGE